MCEHCISRRTFNALAAAGAAGTALGMAEPLKAGEPAEPWNPERPLVVTGKKLVVQPVLMYTTYQPREKTSWKSWSKINSREAAMEERDRISKELAALAAATDFPLQVLPVVAVTSVEEAAKVHETDYDVVLVYPATGGGNVLRACFAAKQPRDTLIFARHNSGPTYYWYEALSTSYLKTSTEPVPGVHSARNHGPVTVDDVVIDDYQELRWRLRALYGLKNFIGQRIVALGGAGGKYDAEAPKIARERYGLQIIEVGYDELTRRIEKVKADAAFVAQTQKWTEQYLAQPGTTLATKKQYVASAFLLYRVFKDWMREHQAPAFTIGACMGTVMPIADTTACLTLSWLNDEGYLAFCESDFVIIPCGIFLHYVCGRPVYLHNSTFPHKAMVTCAHCTAPRRMDGKSYEPAAILTHYESDFGAAPKVDMKVGQEVTFIDPEFSTGRWLGFKGVIKANPFHEICRTQQDVEIQGQWKKLMKEARDSHWMMAYGDHLEALGYAARKIGIRWEGLADQA